MIVEENKIKLYKYAFNIGYIKSYCEQNIWLTPVNELNDPFEGHSKIQYHSPDFLLENPKLLEQMLRLGKTANMNLTKDKFLEQINSPDFQAKLNTFQEKKRSLFSGHGITSFSSDPSNIPMWTYYAGNHHGYCIEFEMDFKKIQNTTNISETETPRLLRDVVNSDFILSFYLDNHEFVFTKVGYSENIPIIKLEELYNKPKFEQIEYLVKNCIGVKYKHWQHEKEFRLIANANSKKSGCLPLPTFAPFLKFTGLIIGANMPQKYRNKISKLHEKYNFNYKKSVLSDNAYSISMVDCKN